MANIEKSKPEFVTRDGIIAYRQQLIDEFAVSIRHQPSDELSNGLSAVSIVRWA